MVPWQSCFFFLFKHRNLVCLVAVDMLILVGLNKLKNDEQVCTVCICGIQQGPLLWIAENLC